MTVSRITSQTGVDSTSNLAVAVGDLMVCFTFRDGNTTPASLVGTWTNIATTSTTSCSARLAFKIATSTSEASGTWTNATSTIIIAYRNAAIGAFTSNAAVNTTFNYPTLSLLEDDGTSWVGGFVATRNGTSPGSVDTAPTGMTFITSVKDATDAAGAHDTNAAVSSWSSQNVATGVGSTGWCTFVYELLDQALPSTYFGNGTIGASETGDILTDKISGVKFTTPVGGGTATRIWSYVRGYGPGVLYKNALYSNTSDDPQNVLSTSDETGMTGDWFAWRKTAISYVFGGSTDIHCSLFCNDTWVMKQDTGSTNQRFIKDAQTYPTFQDPILTGTDYSQLNNTMNMIIEYTPAAGAGASKNLLTLGVG